MDLKAIAQFGIKLTLERQHIVEILKVKMLLR